MKDAAERHLRASAAPWTIVRSTAFLETWIDLMVQTTIVRVVCWSLAAATTRLTSCPCATSGRLVERVIADPGARMQTLDIGGPENITMTSLANGGPTGRPWPSHHGTCRQRTEAISLVFRPFWAERARQAAAALVLDTIDMRFDPAAIRARYPDLPLTSSSDVIARIARERDQRRH
jgi:NADH dehydrogenase